MRNTNNRIEKLKQKALNDPNSKIYKNYLKKVEADKKLRERNIKKSMQENTLVEFKRWMRIIGKDNNQIKSNLEQIELTLKSLSYEEKRIKETINFLFDNIKNEDLPKQVALKKYNLENLLIKAMDYLIQ